MVIQTFCTVHLTLTFWTTNCEWTREDFGCFSPLMFLMTLKQQQEAICMTVVGLNGLNASNDIFDIIQNSCHCFLWPLLEGPGNAHPHSSMLIPSMELTWCPGPPWWICVLFSSFGHSCLKIKPLIQGAFFTADILRYQGSKCTGVANNMNGGWVPLSHSLTKVTHPACEILGPWKQLTEIRCSHR